MKKKEKRKLLDRLEHSIDRNKAFCIRNDMEPTEYIQGVNDMAKVNARTFTEENLAEAFTAWNF